MYCDKKNPLDSLFWLKIFVVAKWDGVVNANKITDKLIVLAN